MRVFVSIFLCFVVVGVARADGAPGWDPWAVHFQASEMLEKEDFAGLEALAAQLKKNGYDIEQESPELPGFYGGLGVPEKSPQKEWVDTLRVLEKWRAAYPKSLTAIMAEVHWYMDYSDEGYTEVPELGGPLAEPGEMAPEKSCMDKATDLLKEALAGTVDDPDCYVEWLQICQMQGSTRPQAQWFFNKGLAIAKEYVPLYVAMTEYLMPSDHPEVEPEKSMKKWADRFPGEKGDALYAFVMHEDSQNYPWTKFSTVPNLDYARAKRGLLGRLNTTNPERWRDEHILASLAAMWSDNLTEKRMLLELEGSIDYDFFLTGEKDYADVQSEKDYAHLRITSGAKAAIGGAESLERAGKVADAEARWLSFTTDPARYVPLEFFYERQGMKDKLLAMKVTISGQTAKEMSETDPGYAPADVLSESTGYYAMMGEWDKAQVAAQRFAQLRPGSIIGDNILLLCAIERGDAEAAERSIMDIVSTKTDKKPYKTAQAVLSGAKDWGAVSGAMKNNNIYLGDGATAIALYYMARGQTDAAKKVINDELPYCAENSGKALLESLVYGSLARTLKPAAILPTPGAPPPMTGSNAMPVTTGTK